MWDLGDAGNNKLFTTDDAASVPKGAYLLKISPEW